MSRLALEVRRRRRWWQPTPAPLERRAVNRALHTLLAAPVDLDRPGPDEWDRIHDGFVGHVSVHRDADGDIEAVGATVWGGNENPAVERDVLAALVTPLLALAEDTGAVLDSNLGVVDRKRLHDFLAEA